MNDPAMSESQRCPQCNAEFVPAASPLGLCPACLLKLGASDPAMKPSQESEPVSSTEVLAAPPAPNRRVRRRVLMGIGAAAIISVPLLWIIVRSSQPGGSPASRAPFSTTIRFALPPPDDTEPIDGAQFAASPDGSRVALAARSTDGETRLWVRTLQSMEWRMLPRTEGAALPFWSPDSQQIAFFAEKKLKRIDVSNGLTHTVCEASSPRGGTWARDGTIVFAPAAVGPIFRVSASGGTPQPVTTLDESGGETAHAWPHVLQDSRSVLFVVTTAGGQHRNSAARSTSSEHAGLHMVSLESGQRKLLVAGAGPAAFAQGFLLFVRGTELLARRFDPYRSEFFEDQRTISGAEHVGDSHPKGAGFAVSDAGLLVHRIGGPTQSQLTWFDRSGRSLSMAADAADDQQFSISPDGRRVVVARRDPRDSTTNIWLIELDRHLTSRLTAGRSHDSSPLWHPDGSRILFVSVRDGKDAVYATDGNGGGKEQLLHESPEPAHLEDVSPDGHFLIYATASVRTGSDLWFLPLEGDRKPQALFQTEFNESEARLSPDGRWIAYVSDESGRDEVYVRPFPQADSRWQISTAGGHRPRWRRDGRELFFVSPDGQLQVVEAQARESFRSTAPRMLFRLRQADEYEVSPDGQRFLTKMRVEDRDRAGLQVILNWQEELKQW